MSNKPQRRARRPCPCMHKCKEPAPSTVFVKFHPFKPGWEIRLCPECLRYSAYSDKEL